MSTSKYFDRIAAAVTALGLLLTILFMNGEALGMVKVVDEDAERYETASLFTANDLDGDWDASNPTAEITLTGDSAVIRGNGAYLKDGSVVITGAGRYVLSGELTDGSVVVDAYESSKVFLLLNGVEIFCSDDACLRVDQADKVFLTLAAGTENRMESAESYSQTALDDHTGGAIFAHDDLTINGSGSLSIVAGYKHGIDANDDLVLAGGTISVTAPEDALHVNDSFRMTAADLTIAAGDDAIHSDTDIYIESGTLLITECYEGLEATCIEVAGGDITIYPTDDAFNANGGTGGMMGGGMMGGEFERGGFDREGEALDGERPQFRDFEGEMPDFDARSESGDLPTPPDGALDGEPPARPDGEASDRDAATDADFPIEQNDSADSEESSVRISGGNILIVNENAQDADGIDSNGSIYITGGTILVSLDGGGSNNAIDFGSENGGTAEISGGTIIACGGASMAESFGESSAQPSISYTGSVAAGSTVALLNSNGETLLEWTVPCGFTYLTVSCPEMALGESYTLRLGDATEGITLESVVTVLGSMSEAGGGLDGFGGFGGGHGHGGFGGRTQSKNE